MRTTINKILVLCGMVVALGSCTEYLDVAPESGLSEDKVFTRIANVKGYFNPVYTKVIQGDGLQIAAWGGMGWNFYSATEIAESGNFSRSNFALRNGTFGDVKAGMLCDTKPGIVKQAYQAIRICNNVIANAERIEDYKDYKEVDDIMGQAYFIRAYAYLAMCRMYGGMPYIDHVMTSDEDWDVPRLTPCETYQRIAQDAQTAYEYFVKADKVRRDPKPGETGNLNTSYQLNLPNGCAALALKSRALLYAASPLSNDGSADLWKAAAEAAKEALEVSAENGYILLPMENWIDNTYGKQYTNEQLWAKSNGKMNYNNGKVRTFMTSMMKGGDKYAYATCPTQNFVDMYETRADVDANNGQSYILRTEADRKAAEAAGVYNSQEPYKNLDKRFYETVYYNGRELKGHTVVRKGSIKGQFNSWYENTDDGVFYSDHIYKGEYTSTATTGYALRRVTGDMNKNIKTTAYVTDPTFTYSELLLNYAEAVFEYKGSIKATADGSTLTAEAALQQIRDRAGLSELDQSKIGDAAYARDRIHNERNIELAFTGMHYYYDTFRWKTASNRIKTPIEIMDIEKVGVSDDYPTGYKFTRLPLQEDRQPRIWEDYMYYISFSSDMNYQFKDFDVSLNGRW